MTLKELHEIIEKALADGVNPDTKVMVDVDNGDDLSFSGKLVSAEVSVFDANFPALFPIDIIEEDEEFAEEHCEDEVVFGLFGTSGV